MNPHRAETQFLTDTHNWDTRPVTFIKKGAAPIYIRSEVAWEWLLINGPHTCVEDTYVATNQDYEFLW